LLKNKELILAQLRLLYLHNHLLRVEATLDKSKLQVLTIRIDSKSIVNFQQKSFLHNKLKFSFQSAKKKLQEMLA
jgi:hypothetical protein